MFAAIIVVCFLCAVNVVAWLKPVEDTIVGVFLRPFIPFLGEGVRWRFERDVDALTRHVETVRLSCDLLDGVLRNRSLGAEHYRVLISRLCEANVPNSSSSLGWGEWGSYSLVQSRDDDGQIRFVYLYPVVEELSRLGFSGLASTADVVPHLLRGGVLNDTVIQNLVMLLQRMPICGERLRLVDVLLSHAEEIFTPGLEFEVERSGPVSWSYANLSLMTLMLGFECSDDPVGWVNRVARENTWMLLLLVQLSVVRWGSYVSQYSFAVSAPANVSWVVVERPELREAYSDTVELLNVLDEDGVELLFTDPRCVCQVALSGHPNAPQWVKDMVVFLFSRGGVL